MHIMQDHHGMVHHQKVGFWMHFMLRVYRRLIDAPDEVRNSNPVFVCPGVLQNFIRAYEQSVFSHANVICMYC